MHEKWVWVFSGAIFGLLHVPNALFGQSVGATAPQVVFAFAVGLTYYVTRRISGTLIVTMVLHALWDFSTFIQAHSVDGLRTSRRALGGFALYLAVILEHRRSGEDPEDRRRREARRRPTRRVQQGVIGVDIPLAMASGAAVTLS